MHPVIAAWNGGPWQFLESVLSGPLHPGGRDATTALLDRAGVNETTTLLDLGCGAGGAVAVARERGANAYGIDRRPPDGPGGVRGDLSRLPFSADAVDVAVAECVMCLLDDPGRAVREARRVLRSGGRFAVSDVVVDGGVPAVSPLLSDPLCLGSRWSASELAAVVRDGGFRVRDQRRHDEDVRAMRDAVAERVDYEGFLAALGPAGDGLLADVRALERAVDRGDIGYVSLIAERR